MTVKTTTPTTLKTNLPERGPGGRAKFTGVHFTPATLPKLITPGTDAADPDYRGLRYRRAEGGPVVAYFRFRMGASVKQIEIGPLGALTLTEIRKRWEQMRDAVRAGQMPTSAKATAKAKEQALRVERASANAPTVGDLAEAYLREVVETQHKRTKETSRLLNQLLELRTWCVNAGRDPGAVKDIRRERADRIDRLTMHELLATLGASAPRSAEQARWAIRSVWRHAISTGRLAGPSPFERIGSGRDTFGAGASRKAKPVAIKRVLSLDEAGALLHWMRRPGTYSRTVADALQIVLATGLRSGEVVGMHTRELEVRHGVLWVNIPGHRMKEGLPHSAPLIGQAAAIARARATGGYLFPKRSGDGPIEQKVLGIEVYVHSGASDSPRYAHLERCPVAGWAPHDLRRTVRTLLAEMGCPFEVAESILAHKLPGVAGVYNLAQHLDARVQWLTQLGQAIEASAVKAGGHHGGA